MVRQVIATAITPCLFLAKRLSDHQINQVPAAVRSLRRVQRGCVVGGWLGCAVCVPNAGGVQVHAEGD